MLQPLKNAIYNWIKTVVDDPTVTIYWMEQGAPRPQRPCVSLKIVTPSIKPFRDDLRFNESDSHFYLNGPREMLVSVNTYGEQGLELAIAIRDSIDDPDIIDQLGAAGLAFVAQGAVDNLTQLLESNFETRGHFDITFGYNINNQTNVVDIEKISINGEDIPSP